MPSPLTCDLLTHDELPIEQGLLFVMHPLITMAVAGCFKCQIILMLDPHYVLTDVLHLLPLS